MKKLLAFLVLIVGCIYVANAQDTPRSTIIANFPEGATKFTCDQVDINGNVVTLSGDVRNEGNANPGIGIGPGGNNPGNEGGNPPGARFPRPVIVTIPGFPVLGSSGGNTTLTCLPGNHCITGVVFLPF